MCIRDRGQGGADQQQRAAIQRIGDMALLHQPLDLQQAVERRVQVALPGFQQGQSQVAVERPGIEILPCLLQPQPIPVPGLDLAALLQACLLYTSRCV